MNISMCKREKSNYRIQFRLYVSTCIVEVRKHLQKYFAYNEKHYFEMIYLLQIET